MEGLAYLLRIKSFTWILKLRQIPIYAKFLYHVEGTSLKGVDIILQVFEYQFIFYEFNWVQVNKEVWQTLSQIFLF